MGETIRFSMLILSMLSAGVSVTLPARNRNQEKHRGRSRPQASGPPAPSIILFSVSAA